MLKEGDPALEIVNAAKESGFDVIDVGHKGLGKMKELFWAVSARKLQILHLAH